MCTMSLHVHHSGYDLFFNRDERRTRPSALPPRAQERDAVRFLAPLDPEGGGSWIAVNEFGLTACLLNGFVDRRSSGLQGTPTTRGELPVTMMGCADEASAEAKLRALSLESFRPFELAVIGSGRSGWRAGWDGVALSVTDGITSPVVSSSFFTEDVRVSREAVYRELERDETLDPLERLERFHRSHLPRRGAHSPCMHREDARTVSATRVRVRGDSCRIEYRGTAPCRSRGKWDALTLTRRACPASADQ